MKFLRYWIEKIESAIDAREIEKAKEGFRVFGFSCFEHTHKQVRTRGFNFATCVRTRAKCFLFIFLVQTCSPRFLFFSPQTFFFCKKKMKDIFFFWQEMKDIILDKLSIRNIHQLYQLIVFISSENLTVSIWHKTTILLKKSEFSFTHTNILFVINMKVKYFSFKKVKLFEGKKKVMWNIYLQLLY